MMGTITPVVRLATNEGGAGTKFCDSDHCEL